VLAKERYALLVEYDISFIAVSVSQDSCCGLTLASLGSLLFIMVFNNAKNACEFSFAA